MALPKHVEEKRQALADKVIKDIQEGKPFFWDSGHYGGQPQNAISGKSYRGGNAVALYVRSMEKGYTDNRWVTFDQANKNGWKVKRGEKGTHVEYWNNKKIVDQVNPESGLKEKVAVELERPVVRNYVVFNAEQVEGMEKTNNRNIENIEGDKVKHMENMLKNSEAPIFEDQLAENFYRPSTDEIHLLPRESFKSLDQFYAVAAHEVAHSTGHESRMNRSMEGNFGSPSYAKEELRAELASMFLHQEYGISFDEKHYENHAAYLQSWAKSLKDDPNELYRAASDAQKIADYIETRMIQKDLVQEKQDGKETEKVQQGIGIETEPSKTVTIPLAPESAALAADVAKESQQYQLQPGSPFKAAWDEKVAPLTEKQKKSQKDDPEKAVKTTKAAAKKTPAKKTTKRSLKVETKPKDNSKALAR